MKIRARKRDREKKKKKKENKKISSIDLFVSYGSESDPRDESGLACNFPFYLLVIQ